ncbi:MAG: hypothetical protein KJ064_15685 [Anaerolineae bacterium]|nr:hypothetical protein [Anaerolineae bacterium]
MARLVRYFLIAVLGAALLGAGLFWPATERVQAQTVPSNQIVPCGPGNVTLPFPTSGSNFLKPISCFAVTGPGQANITLGQILANTITITQGGQTISQVTAADITAINANPGLMEVWVDTGTSWIKVGSTYSAATQTYSFTASTGTTEYTFFYPTSTPIGGSGQGSASGAGSGATTTPTSISSVKCSDGTTLSSPYPQNAAGEFLRVACYTITGPGQVNISLTQVLADAGSNVSSSDKTTIQGNPSAMQVWRMGSWFLVNSSYNAGTQVYTFDAVTGAQIYVFFFPPITRRVGAQGYSFGASAGTTTGNVTDLLPTTIVEDAPPRATLATAGLLLLILGLSPVIRKRELL